jgi:PAS domain S-box-containing protein
MGQTNILIVEDEYVVALDLQANLERLGYAVIARVATGEAAIEKAGTLCPDLVLMDIKLAGKLDGIEAAEQIRARFDQPVIFLTAYADEATLQRARLSQPFGYLLKPFEEPALRSNIEMALYKHHLEQQLRQELAERRRVEAELGRKTEDLALVNALNNAVNRGESLQAIFQLLSSESRKIFACYGATAYLLSEDRRSLVMLDFHLPPATTSAIEAAMGCKMPPLRIPLLAGSPYWETLEAGRVKLVTGPGEVLRRMAATAETVDPPLRPMVQAMIPEISAVTGIQSVVSLPLLSENRPIGLLDIARAEPFSELDLQRMEAIAGQASLILSRKLAEEALHQAHRELEQRVAARTAELAQVNEVLRAEVAERREAEATVRESEGRYRLLVETSPDGILLADLEGKLLMVNSQAASIFGYADPQAMVGLNTWDLSAPEAQAEMLSSLELTRKTGSLRRAEYAYRRKSGATFWGEASASVLRDAAGCPQALISVVHDITERRQSQEDLRQAKDAAEAANRAKTAFLAVMGHELRTPLNGLFIAAEMLGEKCGQDAEQRQYLEVVQACGRQLWQMVEGVLEYAAVDAAADFTPADVALVCHDVAGSFSLRAVRKNITLTFDIAPDLPAVRADARRLSQILQRLLDNALKFTPAGGRVKVTAKSAPAAVEISVADTGIGFQPEDAERIFEPFVQLEASHMVHSEGSGLGLTLARRWATAQGGRLWAESGGAGNGSTFTVWMPVP